VAIWRRPKLIARGDPDHDHAVAQIVARLIELPRRSVVLAEDETHLNLLPHMRASWTLAVKRAGCGGLIVSAVSYHDMAGYELEATLVNAPHHDPIVIGRSRTGDHCQVTLERWLPIDGEPGIEDAVNAIRAIGAASGRPDPARTIDATTEP